MKLTYLKLDTVNLNEESFQKLVLLENNANGEPYSAKELNEIITHATNSTFVCSDEKKIVGMLTVNQNSKKFGGSIYVINLCVDKNYQQKGIATQLFAEFTNYYKDAFLNKIVSISVDKTNLKAINLYNKLGFKLVQDYDDKEQYGMIITFEELSKRFEKNLKN